MLLYICNLYKEGVYMLATFSDFISKNPNCKKFENDEDMRCIFNLLSLEYSIIQMIDASKASVPALAPLAQNVEAVFTDKSKNHINTLDDNFTKQAVGLMIKTILEPFGYTVWKQKDLPRKFGAKEFTSASTYRHSHTNQASLRVQKSIYNGDISLTTLDQDSIIQYFDKAKHITYGEFGEFYSDCVIAEYRVHAERTKHYYSQYRSKLSDEANYMLAKTCLFSWYFRSLISSKFSVKHPSYGVYGAAYLSGDVFSENPKLRIRLLAEFGSRPIEANSHMPIGMSYWQCEE
jgi:hypothetical protein